MSALHGLDKLLYNCFIEVIKMLDIGVEFEWGGLPLLITSGC